MSAKRFRRTGVPLLVGLTVAGTMTLSAGTASAGVWFDTGYYFTTQNACVRYGELNAADNGWSAFDCRDDNNTIYPWHLFVYEG